MNFFLQNRTVLKYSNSNYQLSCFNLAVYAFSYIRYYSSIDSNTYLNKGVVTPLVVYANADEDKLSILADNKIAGVYRWVNKLNGKTYVGSSINIRVRMYKYYDLRYLAKSNRPIERALLSYGFSNFSLEILEYCNKDDVLSREQYYMDLIKPEYNIVKTAGSTVGYKHTPETLAKMRAFVLSDEVKEKKTLAAIKAGAANRKAVLVENTLTNEVTEYESMTEAGKALGVHRNVVVYAANKDGLIKKTYRVKKLN